MTFQAADLPMTQFFGSYQIRARVLPNWVIIPGMLLIDVISNLYLEDSILKKLDIQSTEFVIFRIIITIDANWWSRPRDLQKRWTFSVNGYFEFRAHVPLDV